MQATTQQALEALLHAVLIRASQAQMDDDGSVDEETQQDIDRLIAAAQDPEALVAMLAEDEDEEEPAKKEPAEQEEELGSLRLGLDTVRGALLTEIQLRGLESAWQYAGDLGLSPSETRRMMREINP